MGITTSSSPHRWLHLCLSNIYFSTPISYPPTSCVANSLDRIVDMIFKVTSLRGPMTSMTIFYKPKYQFWWVLCTIPSKFEKRTKQWQDFSEHSLFYVLIHRCYKYLLYKFKKSSFFFIKSHFKFSHICMTNHCTTHIWQIWKCLIPWKN